MEKAEKSVKKRFYISLFLTIYFIVGIPLLVVGATRLSQGGGYVFMLVLGIIGAVVGFYGMPVAWVMYGNARTELALVSAVRNEHLYTVQELSARLASNEKQTSANLDNCIRKGYLTGYLRKGDRLYLNENTELKPTEYSVECTRCGAYVTYTGTGAKCPYCGSALPAPAKSDAEK